MSSKEHIFQISMSFDEDMALNAARDQAANRIFSEVRNTVKNRFGSSYSFRNNDGWEKFAAELVAESIDNIIKEYKDSIIELAAKELAARTLKTKAWKEKIGQ